MLKHYNIYVYTSYTYINAQIQIWYIYNIFPNYENYVDEY